MRRFGQVIRLQPGVLDSYKHYHASIWPEVASKITECNIGSTHGNERMSEGRIKGTIIECAKHHGTFDVRDGFPIRFTISSRFALPA